MLTSQQVNAAANAVAANGNKFLKAISDTCDRFNINTPIRQLCFLAQVGHESGGLFFTEEIASGKAYEGRKDLGNTQKGDGVKFKGRGLIQITGRANYTKLGKFLGVDLAANPTLLGAANVKLCNAEQIKNAALSAGWFWDSRKLNAIADKIDITKDLLTHAPNKTAFIAMTKKINGGTNGLQDRVNRYMKGLPLFV
jgi:putative chitinase